MQRKVSKYCDDYVQEKLRVLIDTLEQVRKNQAINYREYKAHYDRRNRASDTCYRPGDRVWYRNFNGKTKIDDPWDGPYVILCRVGRRHIEFSDKKGMTRRTHVKNIKPFFERAV